MLNSRTPLLPKEGSRSPGDCGVMREAEWSTAACRQARLWFANGMGTSARASSVTADLRRRPVVRLFIVLVPPGLRAHEASKHGDSPNLVLPPSSRRDREATAQLMVA